MAAQDSVDSRSNPPWIASPLRFWLRRIRKWSVRLLGVLFLSVLLFMVAAWALGNLPVNPDFQQAGVDGIDIFIINNGVHADLVLPIYESRFPWLDRIGTHPFPEFDPVYAYAIFGWGNKKFYLETESWDDLKISNVLYAFSGMGDTIMHVSLCSGVQWPSPRVRKIRITPEQFDRLCSFLWRSFRLNADGTVNVVPNAHYNTLDAFYEGTGHYHLFRTCNVWVGSALAESGVRVGYWTLTPDLLFACLPQNEPTSSGEP